MSPVKIMLIRHGEKPESRGPLGVRARGAADERSLTTMGWARAGALARFFDPLDQRFQHPALARPGAIVAARHDPKGREPSRRCVQTVRPLARLAAIKIDERFAKDEESAMMQDLLKRSGVVLLCWAHEDIPKVLRELPGAPPTPSAWPDDRFDVVWVFDRMEEGGWRFTQVAQMLLAGDRPEPIALKEAKAP